MTPKAGPARSARPGRWPWAVLLGHALLVQLLTFVLRPTTTYRAIELDLPRALLGALSACFAVAPLVLAIPSGAVTDRIGERAMALLGSVFVLASALVLALCGHSPAALVGGSVLLGVGHLCSVIGQQTWVANRAHGADSDTAFGRYTFAASLGQAVGPVLMLLFGGRHAIPDTQAIFTLACSGALALVAVSALITPTSRDPSDGAHRQRGGTVRLLRLPGLPRALLTSCVVLAAVDITLVYLPALGSERGIAAGTVGALLTVRGLASMASRLFLGRLVARLGRRRLLVLCTMLSAASMAAAALPFGTAALAVFVALAGFGLGVGQPLTMSWLADAAPRGARGRAMSLRLVGNRAGQVVIPSAAGALAADVGAGGVLVATAAGLAGVGYAARTLPVDRPASAAVPAPPTGRRGAAPRRRRPCRARRCR
ncbi:MFS transporter [Streptomyces armeniacus]|uniref:MFS transporter n=1 Tax=Streptomyces armeniacus TaxID=83291 RepID=A0A345XTM4_9ACTN|nr:MFS transporter [Streptomyces armeniacus]AXK34990.1 MFS transporter [Streptomyces armeniacus]